MAVSSALTTPIDLRNQDARKLPHEKQVPEFVTIIDYYSRTWYATITADTKYYTHCACLATCLLISGQKNQGNPMVIYLRPFGLFLTVSKNGSDSLGGAMQIKIRHHYRAKLLI